MKVYRNELRIAMKASKGSTDVPELTMPYPQPLDEEIIRLAGRTLKKRHLQTFVWAYSCRPSWDEIQVLFGKHLGADIDRESIERYGRESKKRLIDAMKSKAQARKN